MVRSLLTRLSLLLAVGLAAAHLGNEASAAPVDLLISSVSSNSILRYGSDGTFKGRFDNYTGPNNPLANPFGLAFSNDGSKLFVASLGNGSILQYDANSGAYQRTIATSAMGISYPNDIAVGPDNNLYVANYASNSILRYSTGSSPAFLGTFASGAATLGVTGLAFGTDPGNNNATVLYAVSSLNNTVTKLSATGVVESVIYSSGPSNPNPLNAPSDIAVNPNSGNVAISSFRSGSSTGPSSVGTRVTIQSPNPSSPSNGGMSSMASAQLRGPAGLAFDPNASLANPVLLIASYENNQIVRAVGASTLVPGVGLVESYTIDPTPFISTSQAAQGGLNGPIYMTFFPPNTQGLPGGGGGTGGGGTGLSGTGAAVPEPASVALTGLGVVLMVGYSQRRRKSA